MPRWLETSLSLVTSLCLTRSCTCLATDSQDSMTQDAMKLFSEPQPCPPTAVTTQFWTQPSKAKSMFPCFCDPQHICKTFQTCQESLLPTLGGLLLWGHCVVPRKCRSCLDGRLRWLCGATETRGGVIECNMNNRNYVRLQKPVQ